MFFSARYRPRSLAVNPPGTLVQIREIFLNRNPGPARAPGRVRALDLTVALVTMGILLVGCTGEKAIPLSELPTSTTPPIVTTPHQLETTDEMRQLARQQCLDDPDLEQGEVNAVDPADPDQILATALVECSSVR